jgi:hypothetical protein
MQYTHTLYTRTPTHYICSSPIESCFDAINIVSPGSASSCSHYTHHFIRVRKFKERFSMTDVRSQANKRTFASAGTLVLSSAVTVHQYSIPYSLMVHQYSIPYSLHTHYWCISIAFHTRYTLTTGASVEHSILTTHSLLVHQYSIPYSLHTHYSCCRYF